MATAIQKITCLGVSRDIPFNKLVLSQSNVRRVKAGISVEGLAEDIARRGLLQNLVVRPVLDGDGQETGTFEVPAGGRRYRALELLVKGKRLARTAPVRCTVREPGSPISAEEDSLAENTQREPLHLLDQFRAFKTLVDERGMGVEEIAARFFVSPAIVRQRLKLAGIAPVLLEAYADDGMTLDQLMAFTVSADHARQVQVWDQVKSTYQKDGYYIRRLLTESSVAASDRRAVFAGVEAYEAAGGHVSRDLFQQDGGGWLDDVALLDRLVAEKLTHEAETVGTEGWKWVEAALDFTYGHAAGLRRIYGQRPEVSDEEQAAHEARTDELECLYAAHEGEEDVPDEAIARIEALEAEIAAFNNPPVTYDPAEVARGGAFVTVDHQGRLRVERGFVKPEDEPVVEPTTDGGDGTEASTSGEPAPHGPAVITVGGQTEPEEPDEDGAVKPLSERLVTELTAAKTVALRDAVGRDPDTAHLAVLHALCLPVFYHYGHDSCLELTARSAGLATQAPGLTDSASAQAIDARHAFWAERLPKRSDELWPALVALGPDERQHLLAHAASATATVNVTREPFNRRSPGALAHGEVLARHVRLDMAEAGWRPTADNYLGRVPKARILDAVRQANGEMAAQLIDHLKKPEMAKEAERLLTDTGWVPEPLLVAGDEPDTTEPDGAVESLPAFLTEDDEAGEDEPDEADLDDAPHAIAAE